MAPPSDPFPARAKPPGPAPAAPGACSSSSRAGAPSLASPCGRQTLRLGAPQISGTVLASRVGVEEAPGVRGGAPGPREDAAVSSCGAPGMRGAQLWERVEAATWGAPGRAPPPGGRSTCGGRAVGRCFQSRRGFCPEPRASPAACGQFGPRPVRGWRVSGWSPHPALLENSAGGGGGCKQSAPRPSSRGHFALGFSLGGGGGLSCGYLRSAVLKGWFGNGNKIFIRENTLY